MESPPSCFEDRVDRTFVGRSELLASFTHALASEGPLKLINVHGVTGSGKSFLARRFAQLGHAAGLKTVKVQFDGKDGEGSVPTTSHQEILRHLALGLGAPTPRFATAYLAWSLSNEFTSSRESSLLSENVREVFKSGLSEVINFLTVSSLGPGGLVVAAAHTGWRFVTERVSVEPLAAFHKSPAGKEFCAALKRVHAHEIPAQLGGYLARDLDENLAPRTGGAARGLIVFDSWEQFEMNYPDRRSRWFQESQIAGFFAACRPFIQFVIVGQMPVTWLDEDPRLRDADPIHFMPVQGLTRSEAASYLRDRRNIQSQIWIDRLLEVTAEKCSGAETLHHSLSLGVVADTALGLLAADMGAKPESLQVRANDLEDMVRRFMAVREDQEPFIERLALTPRFDGRALAAAQGKPFDEFTALSDYEALTRFSFVQSPASGWLTMHGQMRKYIRERMARYRPDRLSLAHSLWERHYSERGLSALAFRHRLAADPLPAIRYWAGEIEAAHSAGAGRHLQELLDWGFEADDERPYLSPSEACLFSLTWAQGLRRSYLGDGQAQLAQALSLTDRAMGDSSADDPALRGSVYLERGSILLAQASLDSTDITLYEAAAEAFSQAQVRFEERSRDWCRALVGKQKALGLWGRRVASVPLLEEAVAVGQAVLSHAVVEGDELAREVQEGLCLGYAMLGELKSSIADCKEAASIGRTVLKTCSRESHPLTWHRVNGGLGAAYRTWADLVPGSREIKLSIAADREAIRALQRDEAPLLWAQSQVNLANSLIELARRTGDRGPAIEALAACSLAQEVLTRENEPLLWSSAYGNAAKAHRIVAELEGDPERFAQSASCYRIALEVRSKEASAFVWALGNLNLADTLRLWDLMEPSVERLEESIRRYRQALEVFTADTAPALFEWATSGLNLAEARRAESAQY